MVGGWRIWATVRSAHGGWLGGAGAMSLPVAWWLRGADAPGADPCWPPSEVCADSLDVRLRSPGQQPARMVASW